MTTAVKSNGRNIKFCCNVTIKLSMVVHNLYPGECYGALLINRTWYIYVRSDRIRAGLIVSGVNIYGVHHDIHDTSINKGGSKQSEISLYLSLLSMYASSTILIY